MKECVTHSHACDCREREFARQISISREALQWAKEFFVARDAMNAKVHCAPLRLSPITERINLAVESLDMWINKELK